MSIRSFAQRYEPMRMFGYISLIGLVLLLLYKTMFENEKKDLTPRYTMIECAEIYLAYEMKNKRQEREDSQVKTKGQGQNKDF